MITSLQFTRHRLLTGSAISHSVDKKDFYNVSGLKFCQVEHDPVYESQSGLKFFYQVCVLVTEYAKP
jgi:hypothetical protein